MWPQHHVQSLVQFSSVPYQYEEHILLWATSARKFQRIALI